MQHTQPWAKIYPTERSVEIFKDDKKMLQRVQKFC